MILAFVGLADLIPFIVFGFFVFAVWAMLSLISQRNSRAQERLARLSRPASLAEIDLTRRNGDIKARLPELEFFYAEIHGGASAAGGAEQN